VADPAVHPDCTSCDPRSACPYHEGLADGRDEEQEAVVAWLRSRQMVLPARSSGASTVADPNLTAVIRSALTCGCPAPYDLCPHGDPTPLAEALAGAILNDPVTPVRLCGVDCVTEREMAEALGRDEERAAVVAFLRRSADRRFAACADLIGGGGHRG